VKGRRQSRRPFAVLLGCQPERGRLRRLPAAGGITWRHALEPAATLPAVTASKIRFCAVALFIAVLAGACGSSGDDNKATGAKADYVAKIDPICTDLQGKIGDLGQDPAKQAQAVQDAVAKMKTIPIPSNDDQRAHLYIAAMENLYLSLQDVDQARMVNDQTRADKALTGAKANNKTAAEAAKSYGMVECAKTL